MSQNVGQIDLGLGINQRSFNRQLNGIASGAQRSVVSAFSGLGKAIGVTLGIKAIASFGKSCLKLGSDLSEVQNVVDVTFGDMAQDVNNFASTAIEQFGLSETAAKRYTGTMGAMLKSSGITTSKALEMSKAITGLSADMASFYNLESEQAFEKIRSGISGETEPLKQLGINMSVANLEAYAMAEGISKAYSKMTQQEQTLLRYNYLLSVTKDAQGDFARTSDSWANQTRILAEQFNALKAAIGQGLIAAFTPIVKGLNIIIGKLRVAAGYFKAFMELIFGKQSSSAGSGMEQVAESTSNVVDSAGVASDAVEGVGDAANKAGKKAKGALASFDELNQLSISDGSGSDSGSGDSGIEDMGGSVDVDLGKVDTDAEKLGGILDGVLGQLSTMKDLFSQGFEIGLGDKWQKQVSDIKSSIQGIKLSLKDIFTDSDVIQSAKGLAESIALNLGKVSGSAVSIGTTVAQNLLGGVDKYLQQNSQFIKDRLIGIMDAKAEIANLAGDFAVTFSDIFSVFGNEDAQQITANIISVFYNASLGMEEILSKLGRDILMCITKPIEENKDKIKLALENTLRPLESITGTLSKGITDFFTDFISMYDTYVEPSFTRFKSGISEVFGSLLDAYNEYIAPTLMNIATRFGELYENHIKPMVEKMNETIGKAFEMISTLWQNILAPIISQLIDVLAPSVQAAIENIWLAVEKAIKYVLDMLNALFEILGGVLDFLTGVFSGDWDKAWEGIKEVVSGIGSAIETLICDGLGGIITFLGEAFINSWEGAKQGICNLFSPLGEWFDESVIKPIDEFFSNLWTMITGNATKAWMDIKLAWMKAGTWFDETIIQPIQEFFIKLWLEIQSQAEFAWTYIKGVWGAAVNWFRDTIIEPIKQKFTEWKTSISTLATQAWTGVKTAWNSAKQWFDNTIINPVGKAFDTMWNGVKTTCGNAFNGIKNAVKTPLNFVIDMINKVIRGLNSLKIDIPEWVPGVGGSTWGISIPNIPKLARGGVVDQPTLAMVGEAGKEAVVPLQNNTEWTGQVASLLASALLPFMQGSSGGDMNRDIVFNLGDVELARAFLPSLIREADRQGVTIGG